MRYFWHIFMESWSGLPERDLDVDQRTAVVERLALLPAVNSEFCHCVPIKKGLVRCWS